MGRGVGVGVGVDVGVGVGVLVGVKVGLGVGVGALPPQLDKANPINAKRPISNNSLFLSNVIPPVPETWLLFL
jgi:hypothetical protein